MDVIIAQQHETIDALCYRYYGHTNLKVEAVYAANPGLCELGANLPIGTPVKMPVVTAKKTTETIKLWS